MDLRQKKTMKAIREAFLEIHAKKPIEKITIKELTELAQISKATFYLHYRDIYDLEECLQKESIAKICQSIEHPEWVITDSAEFARELFRAFRAHDALRNVLFSGNRAAMIPDYVEKELQKHIFAKYPELQKDIKFRALLTFEVYGGFYTYRLHAESFGEDEIVAEISEISDALSRAERYHYFAVQDRSDYNCKNV